MHIKYYINVLYLNMFCIICLLQCRAAVNLDPLSFCTGETGGAKVLPPPGARSAAAGEERVKGNPMYREIPCTGKSITKGNPL